MFFSFRPEINLIYMRRISLLAGLFFFLITSCKKTDDIIIKDNVPPPDGTIDSTTIDIYINKCYVNLMGREPVGNEKTDAKTILRQNNFSEADRKQFIGGLLSRPEYKRNQFNIVRNDYLQNVDSQEIAIQKLIFENLIQQPQYAPFYDLLNGEITRLDLLMKVNTDMAAGTLDYKGMLKRSVYNYFYDQINMGTENFVVSTFQNFLFRYPSDQELLSGKTMVDGNTATLFLQIGNTRQDYVDIFFDSNDFYEGQVRLMFGRYLFRQPTSAEAAFYAAIYKDSGNFAELQKAFFSLDEYAGID